MMVDRLVSLICLSLFFDDIFSIDRVRFVSMRQADRSQPANQPHGKPGMNIETEIEGESRKQTNRRQCSGPEQESGGASVASQLVKRIKSGLISKVVAEVGWDEWMEWPDRDRAGLTPVMGGIAVAIVNEARK